jgi:hypothetical protein
MAFLNGGLDRPASSRSEDNNNNKREGGGCGGSKRVIMQSGNIDIVNSRSNNKKKKTMGNLVKDANGGARSCTPTSKRVLVNRNILIISRTDFIYIHHVIPYKIVYLRPYFRDHLFCEIASV